MFRSLFKEERQKRQEEMEDASYQVLGEDAEAEIVVKKSRFLAHLTRTGTEEEAQDYIRRMKKQYWDAKHNCSAFVIGPKNELSRCSDDGEPSGTAGRPMLEVLTGSGLHDTAAVVTRYFGGVLLGTGGLVRAYQGALREALAKARILTMRLCVPVELEIPYTLLGRVQNLLDKEKIVPEIAYAEKVRLKALIPASEKERVLQALRNETNGELQCSTGEPRMAAV